MGGFQQRTDRKMRGSLFFSLRRSHLSGVGRRHAVSCALSALHFTSLNKLIPRTTARPLLASPATDDEDGRYLAAEGARESTRSVR